LGPGFDVFALALEEPRDRLEIVTNSSTRRTVEISVGNADVPTRASKNAAGAVVQSIAHRFKIYQRITLRLSKGVPIGVGMGSSGASAAAAAFAMNRVFNLNMDVAMLAAYAGEGEKVASGAAHLDNVTASILGGFVIVRKGALPIRFDPPESLAVVVVTPKLKLPRRKTAYARSLVPTRVGTMDMVSNVSMASTIVAGFAKKDVGLIGEGMEDSVVEPARARMDPGFEAVKKAVRQSGAAGVCLSGAGPSLLAVVDRERAGPRTVLDSMVEAFVSRGVEAGGFDTSVGEGARVVESS
jgi:homoserine kinase